MPKTEHLTTRTAITEAYFGGGSGQPRLVMVMGEHAQELLRDFTPGIVVPHPSSLRVKPINLVPAAAKKKVKNLVTVLGNDLDDA
jgi:hypothetical protein